MLCSIYLKKDVVIIPTMGRVPEGFHLAVEPIAVVPVSDSDRLRHALVEAVARENPSVPSSRNREEGKRRRAIFHKYAKVRSAPELQRSTRSWSIEEENGRYQIVGTKEAPYGGKRADPEQKEMFAAGTTVDAVVNRMIAILQSAANQ